MTTRRCDYDLLRVLSMAGVVYLHAVAGALREATGLLWHVSNAVSSLFTVAVPLFFMLSGALLLSGGRDIDLTALFHRRLPKVLLPLLVWSAVIIAAFALRDGNAVALPKLLSLPSTPVMVPYWFLYALVPMYLIAPLLKKMTDHLTDSHWRYLVLLWLVFTLLFNTLHAFLPAGGAARTLFTLHWTLNLNFVGGYLGYFLLGAWLARLKTMPPRQLLWLGSVALWVVITLGTYWGTRQSGGYDERFKSYLNLFTAVLSILLFLLTRSYLERRNTPPLLCALSGLSFGIYLAHPLIIILWQRIFGIYLPGGIIGIGQQLLFYGGILLTCLVGALVLSSIRPLCYLFTGQSFSSACRESNLFALFRRKAH